MQIGSLYKVKTSFYAYFVKKNERKFYSDRKITKGSVILLIEKRPAVHSVRYTDSDGIPSEEYIFFTEENEKVRAASIDVDQHPEKYMVEISK